LAASWVLLIHPLSLSRQDVGYGHGVTTWTYALTECGALPHYLKLVFWPFPLVLDYGNAMVSHPRQVLPQALILAVLLAITALAFVRRPAVGFAGVWFFLILAPTSSVIPVVLSPMAEHRLYLPLAAPAMLVVLGLYAWMGRLSLILTTALAMTCGLLTFERNQDYGSETALWQQVVDLRPGNARAHNNLGLAFSKKGQWEAAMDQYQKALQIDPDYAPAHSNLGVALMQSGRVDEALFQLQKSLKINPTVPETIINFGIAVSQKGRLDEGIMEFQKALQINPNYAEAHNDLGIALAEKGHVEEAIAQFQEALQLKPDFVLAQNNLAKAQAMRWQAPGSK
jgi:Flp pilus assembly protein TadD